MTATGQNSTDLVVVVDGSDTLTVSRPGHPLATYDRDRLETAYLLRLEHTNPIAPAGCSAARAEAEGVQRAR